MRVFFFVVSPQFLLLITQGSFLIAYLPFRSACTDFNPPPAVRISLCLGELQISLVEIWHFARFALSSPKY